jgi:hypothetical protein
MVAVDDDGGAYFRAAFNLTQVGEDHRRQLIGCPAFLGAPCGVFHFLASGLLQADRPAKSVDQQREQHHHDDEVFDAIATPLFEVSI